MPRASPARSRPARKARPQQEAAEEVRRALAVPPPPGQHSLLAPTWRKYSVMARAVQDISVADRRNVFSWLRQVALTPDHPGDEHFFLVSHGLTIGEFCGGNV
jgi:hypothetical protein